MASISSYLDAISSAIYGREVRSAIVNALDAINTESAAAKSDSSTAKSNASSAVSTANSALSAVSAKLDIPETVSFSIATSAWSGSGPYTYTISKSSVTAKTNCVFNITSSVDFAMDWETSAGKIVLTCTTKPTGTITGTIVLIETA